jgi:hypothetical protein
MVSADLLVRRSSLPVHQTVKDKAARPGPKASDALADPDEVLPAAEHSVQCPEAVRDFRLSAWVDAPEPWASWRCPVPQPPDAPPKAVAQVALKEVPQLVFALERQLDPTSERELRAVQPEL